MMKTTCYTNGLFEPFNKLTYLAAAAVAINKNLKIRSTDEARNRRRRRYPRYRMGG